MTLAITFVQLSLFSVHLDKTSTNKIAMNRLIVVAVVVSFAFTAAVAESDDTDVSIESLTESSESVTTNADSETANTDSVMNSAVGTAESVYSAADEVAQEQEERLTEAIGDLITYFTNAITDMSNLLEDIKNIGSSNSETARSNLVDHLMSYVEDTGMMRQQIGRVMQLRAQFQNSILDLLYSMPINAEDAKKIESDLREQIKLRADRIPGMKKMMQIHHHMRQGVSNFVPNLNV